MCIFTLYPRGLIPHNQMLIMKNERKYKKVLGQAISWVAKNIDKLDTITDVIKILAEDGKEEVVSFKMTAEYTTEEGRTFRMSLPISKVKDSSDAANTIASLIVVSASSLKATVEEIIKDEVTNSEVTTSKSSATKPASK
jgi:hypothetical protein